MEQENVLIDRKVGGAIKGVAIILMLIHHFFCFPDWHASTIEYPYLDTFAKLFCQPSRICVPIFAFLTGYFYFYNKNKTYSYSFKKILNLWINYLIVFLVMFIPAIASGAYNLSVGAFFLEFFAIEMPIMIFCWYVLFYFVIMLMMPLYSKFAEKSPVLAFIISVLIYPITSGILAIFKISNVRVLEIINYCLWWIPCVTVGYLFAQKNLFEKFPKFERLTSGGGILLKGLIYVIIIFVAMFCRLYTSMDFIVTPVVIFYMAQLFIPIREKKIIKPILVLGKYSLLIWFVHGAFFNIFKEYTQWFLYLPKNPLLVLIWGTIICLLASWILSFPINAINKLINKICFQKKKEIKKAEE